MLKREDLHNYQNYAANFIINNQLTYLALDCGLGKTATTLTAIEELLHNLFEVQKVLVICPLRVGEVWRTEIQKWEHLYNLNIAVAIGTASERLYQLRRKADIYVINRENVEWLVEKSGLCSGFDMLVIDESSSFKNHQSKRFKAVMKIRPKVKRVVLLSATPAANNLMDLWSQFRILDLGQRLHRFIGQYRNEYFVPDKRNGQVIFSYKPQQNAEQKIYDKIGDITISMKAIDHLQMPELLTIEHKVILSEQERKRYDTLKKDLTVELADGEITAANAAALSGKLCQMANGAIYDDNGDVQHIHNRKLDCLEDLIESANGKPVLIAYWFQHDRDRIAERLCKLKIPFSYIDSKDSIRRWNEGEIPVALIHPASAGHGLNLQKGGNTIIWLGLTWSLELYQQTNARLWRQGQTAETVIIHHIIAERTIDEQIITALAKKDKTQSDLIDAVKANL